MQKSKFIKKHVFINQDKKNHTTPIYFSIFQICIYIFVFVVLDLLCAAYVVHGAIWHDRVDGFCAMSTKFTTAWEHNKSAAFATKARENEGQCGDIKNRLRTQPKARDKGQRQ